MHRTRYLVRIPEMCGNSNVDIPNLGLGDLMLPQADSLAVSDGSCARLQVDCVHNVQPLRWEDRPLATCSSGHCLSTPCLYPRIPTA